MRAFSHIGLFTKPNDTRVDKTLHQLYDYLIRQGYQVFCDQNTGLILNLAALPNESLARQIDLAIVVGGDNLGRVGFLVDVSPDEMLQQLDSMLNGDYRQEDRCILQAQAERDGESIGAGMAINDVVLHVRNEVRMIEFTTRIDGAFVNTQRADGMIIATPTGSTAYALSSGGPIMHPALNALVLVPICPHTLSDRPLVLSSQSSIEIELCEERDIPARLSFDGHNNIELESADIIRIQTHPEKLRLLHPNQYDYYHILREKLYWGVQL